MLLLMESLGAQNLKVMTYNIRLDVASDGENAWENRRDFLGGQIRFYEPDILGIQEGLPQQVAYLQQMLDEYHSVGAGREGNGKGESTHIFFKKDRFEQLTSQTFWLSSTPDSVSMGWDAACLRVCTAVLLREKSGGQYFWVLNTHLDHVGEQARKNGVALILNRLKILNPQGHPALLMGDFNAMPESAAIQSVLQELIDAREMAGANAFGPDGTFNGFKFHEPVQKRIDYIFLSSKTVWKVLKHAVLTDSKELRYPSDHFPVWAEMEWRKGY